MRQPKPHDAKSHRTCLMHVNGLVADITVGRAPCYGCIGDCGNASLMAQLSQLWCSPSASPSARALVPHSMICWARGPDPDRYRYQSGESEGVRCAAYYTGGGQRLRLAIRCRSTSNDIEIRGVLTQQADKVTGTWEERTFNAAGEASGRMTSGKMNLSITGGGFSGSMSVSSERLTTNGGDHNFGNPNEKRQRHIGQGLIARGMDLPTPCASQDE